MSDETAKVVPAKLYSRRLEPRTLDQGISWFAANAGQGYGLLYTPASCFLATVDQTGKLIASSGKEASSGSEAKPRALEQTDLNIVFEARLFNGNAELRWLRQSGDQGVEVVLSETQGEGEAIQNIYGKIESQTGYLLWGQSTGKSVGDWTQFGEARVGAFFVPLKDVPEKGYARFRGIEYLGEYEDGNAAVAEERLIGIEPT